jgi:hypothetical protein
VFQEEGRIGQTVRHYYYQLQSTGAIQLIADKPTSGKNAYSYVSQLLTEARRSHQLPWEAVIDPGRRAITYPAYESLGQCVEETTSGYYRLDPWRGQPRRLEAWVEKDAMLEFVRRAVEPYRVPVHETRGYASATVIKEAAERYGTGRGWTLLYCGDFDPTGLHIDHHLHDTLQSHGARHEIERVALTLEDTRQLPPVAALEINASDSRAKGFIEEYGPAQRGYELDAMPAHALRDKLIAAVTSRMDMEEYLRAMRIERDVEVHLKDQLRWSLDGFEDSVLQEGIPGTTWDADVLQRYLAAAAA